jgi:hypothetical protein
MTSDSNANPTQERALIRFLLGNRTFVSYMSILMLIYAIWAIIEVITNATGATWWAPDTGIPVEDIFGDPDRVQNINNGWVIGTGAVFGTIGTMIQYFYRAAPYVDASMQATAALIISAVKEEQIQETAEKIADEIVAEAEAEKAAAIVAEEEAAEKEAEEAAAIVAAEEAEAEEEGDASTETEVAVESGQRKKF